MDDPKAIAAGNLMAEALKTFQGIAVQGPGPGIVPRVRNMYIHEIWIKCPRDNKLLTSLKVFLQEQRQLVLGKKGNSNVQVVFDVDPV